MPLYEYECLSCGTRSEVLQRFSDDPLTTCEACGGELRKLLSAPAFQLKGSGWYKTDYAPSGSAKKKDGDAKEGGAKEGGESSSKDSSSSGSSSAGESSSGSSGSSGGDGKAAKASSG